MSNPLVSVILAVKNGDRYLAQGLQSIFNQDYPYFEVIVVDGRSTDNTDMIVRSFSQLSQPLRYIYQTEEGLANAWNLGVATASGEFIAFLDSDDLWTSDKLSSQLNILNENSDTEYAIGYMKFSLESGYSIPQGFKKELLNQDILGRVPGTLLARKSLFKKIGNFSQKYKIASDVDWFTRVKDNQVIGSTLTKTILLKRVHDANLSSNAQLNNQELLKILRRSIRST